MDERTLAAIVAAMRELGAGDDTIRRLEDEVRTARSATTPAV